MAETPAPASVGMAIEDVDTPALLVDLDAFERNLKRMADAIEGSPARLRPRRPIRRAGPAGPGGGRR